MDPASNVTTLDAAQGRARIALIKRLADVCCLPSSRVNTFERAMTADLLVEMLREASPRDRARVSRRLASLQEIPTRLLRLLLRDEIEVARPLLENETSLCEADLIDCVRQAGPEHRLLIARRREVGELLCEALVEAGDPAVIEVLLKNSGALLSADAVDGLVAASQTAPEFIAGLMRRAELRPAHAYVLFWWSEPDQRRAILQRFAVSREVLQEAAGDVFALAAEENWQDPLVRKALQFVERRQRNRAAIAPLALRQPGRGDRRRPGGHDPRRRARDRLPRRHQADHRRQDLHRPVRRAHRHPVQGHRPAAERRARPVEGAAPHRHRHHRRDGARPAAHALHLRHDGCGPAQTVLRYWNWSLSSALTPALVRAIREGDDSLLDEYSQPQRAAMLALAKDFR